MKKNELKIHDLKTEIYDLKKWRDVERSRSKRITDIWFDGWDDMRFLRVKYRKIERYANCCINKHANDPQILKELCEHLIRVFQDDIKGWLSATRERELDLNVREFPATTPKQHLQRVLFKKI